MGSIDIEAIRDNIRAQTGGWFAIPSFFGGMGRVIDLFGMLNVYRYYASTEEADIDAMRRDFMAVGRDIWGAMETEGPTVLAEAIKYAEITKDIEEEIQFSLPLKGGPPEKQKPIKA
jgi:hypothetical protein